MTTAPVLFIVSGPSGSGKGVALSVFTERLGVPKVVTYATRRPRPNERDGEVYRFVSDNELSKLRNAGALAEENRTYGSSSYASPREILAWDDATTDCVMELDPEGFFFIKENSTRHVVGVFIVPSSFEDLEQRIRIRAPENDLSVRIAVARQQLMVASAYDHVIVSGELNAFMDEVERVGRVEISESAARHHTRMLVSGLRSASSADPHDSTKRTAGFA